MTPLEKVLKLRCLKCNCIIHLYMICMSYDIKKKVGVKLKFWLPTINPLKVGVKWTLIRAFYIPLEICFWRLQDIVLTFFKNIWFEKDMNIQNYEIANVPVLGILLRTLEKKWHLDIVSMEKHKLYYRDGSGASSQRLLLV
jgi:hypothetical protein